MYSNCAALIAILGIASALPGGMDYPATFSQTSTPSSSSNNSAPGLSSPTFTPSYITSSWVPIYTPPGGDCGLECGGVCGDGIVQAPEECDLGVELNNTPGSGCDSTCHQYCYCGDGKVEAPEECDAGP